MPKNKKPKSRISSLANASVLRKFTILFILMSILPISILYYFYYQIKESGKIDISEESFNVTLILVMCGVLLGFWIMRTMLTNIIEITRANRENLEEVLGEEKVRELTENNDEVAVLARSFGEITSRLEENVRKLELAKKTLHSVLSKVGSGISSMQNIDSFLELIVETVAEALSARVGVLMLLDESKGELYLKSVYGTSYDAKNPLRMKMEGSFFSSVMKTHKPLLIPRLAGEGPATKEQEALFEMPLLCAPLLLHEKALGVISVSGRKDGGNFTEEEMSLLYNLALQTAVAIENSTLNADAEKTYFETVSALAMAVEAKDRYSRGHLDRVAEYCQQIAKKLNLGAEDIKILCDGARLHDLGKIGILDDVLKKPSKLTEQEWEIMRKHTEIGEGIIKPIRSLAKLCDVVRHHHEKLDGSGYPDGLKGDEISLLARILCVADIYDALTTDRPYRKAFPVGEAKEELIKMKGKLDPKVVDAFLETL